MAAAFVVPNSFLSVCGIVLDSIAVSRQYLLACCGGLLEATSAPLGGALGASGRPPGADFPGPLLGLSRVAPGLGASWAALGAPKSSCAEKLKFFNITTFVLVFTASGSHPGPPSELLLGGSWAALIGFGWLQKRFLVALGPIPGVAADPSPPRTRTLFLHRLV